MKYHILLLLVALTSGSAQLWSQKSPGEALTIKLNESGDEYLKFNFLGQVWLSFSQPNQWQSYNSQPFDETKTAHLRAVLSL
ncbi:MAG: hypothetical protein GC193_03955 [Cryomorphaceae bacterium]|nr:hypothetical protein [Cryomorphaceae bacterium]